MKVAILGKPKMGKTFLGDQLVDRCLEEGASRALIWDTIRQQQFAGVALDDIRAAARFPLQRRWVFRAPVTADEVARLALSLQERGAGRLVVVLDETRLPGVVANFRWATEALARLGYGQREVDLIITTQVPAYVPTDLRSICEFYIFALTSARDLDMLQDLAVPDETIAMVRRLQPYQFVHCAPGG